MGKLIAAATMALWSEGEPPHSNQEKDSHAANLGARSEGLVVTREISSAASCAPARSMRSVTVGSKGKPSRNS